MSDIAIEVNNLSKLYKLGEIGTGTISHDLNRWWSRVRGKEDPYLILGEENRRDSKGLSDYVWALKDINFKVNKGNVLGIIGRNGAGKSTLLKLLSRVTNPTTGTIMANGRIASLLEVGTGFHPDLTGRENIFLNGAIMGMTKREIKSKFEEIVDFAGVERYVDTPVKRYSSGMYVRLAFAVAAFLEPEILIVDEVLAVGDAEFQKKCLGRMKDVSKNDGRTVLFVSHNMTAMNTLCNSAMYMRNGKIVEVGETSEIINMYLSSGNETTTRIKYSESDLPGDEVAKLLEVKLVDDIGNDINVLDFYKGGGIEFTYKVIKDGFCPLPNIHLFNQNGDYVFVSAESSSTSFSHKGIYSTTMYLPGHVLNDGRYIVGIALSTMIPEKIHVYVKDALIFDVIEDMNFRSFDYRGAIPGIVRPNFKWKTLKME